MNNEALQALVCEISTRFFGISFKHHAYFNPRLRTTGGRYMLRTHHIEINPAVYERYGQQELIAVIKHELCHYHLHLQGRGYKHRDKDFKTLANNVGAPRFCQPLQAVKPKHIYECSQCGVRFYRQRKIDTLRYYCGQCKGEIKKV